MNFGGSTSSLRLSLVFFSLEGPTGEVGPFPFLSETLGPPLSLLAGGWPAFALSSSALREQK